MRVHVHRQGYLHCSIEGCHRDSILVPFCALASMSLTIIFIVVFLLDLSASRASSEFDRVQLLLSFPDFVILILSNSVRNKWSNPIILITHCSFPGSQEAIIYFFSRSLEHSALYRGSSYCSRSFAVLTPPICSVGNFLHFLPAPGFTGSIIYFLSEFCMFSPWFYI